MLTTLCKYLNNYFIHDRSAFHFGEFEIEDGEFTGVTTTGSVSHLDATAPPMKNVFVVSGDGTITIVNEIPPM